MTNDRDGQSMYVGRDDLSSSLHGKVEPSVPDARPHEPGSEDSPIQRPTWSSNGISRNAATVMNSRGQRKNIPSDSNALTNPWSLAIFNGPGNDCSP